MEITTKDFWEEYWGEIELPQRINKNFKNERVISQTIVNHIDRSNYDKLALEIGCAPGKWLVFLYEELGYKVEGFEYLDIAAEKTRENLIGCNIPEDSFNIITADFLSQKPSEKYDLVTSFGFIEHFDNYSEIFDKHIQYTKSNGYIVVGFPCFKGVNFMIQKSIDKITGSQIIENHELEIMDKDVVLNMLSSKDLDIVYTDYIGGFEPSLFNVQDIKNKFLRFIFKGILKTLNLFYGNTKNKFFASYFIFIVKKK